MHPLILDHVHDSCVVSDEKKSPGHENRPFRGQMTNHGQKTHSLLYVKSTTEALDFIESDEWGLGFLGSSRIVRENWKNVLL